MIEKLNAIAQGYGALFDMLLTFALVVSTIIYVWITRGMLGEMILSRRLAIEPRLVYSLNSTKFTAESPSMTVSIKNVGRGDAFTVTFCALIHYIRNNKTIRQETTIRNSNLILKSGAKFESEISFSFDGGQPLVNSGGDVAFETEIRSADGDGHETISQQLYTLVCYEPDSERPFILIRKIYKVPFLLRIVRRFTSPESGKYWDLSPPSVRRTRR